MEVKEARDLHCGHQDEVTEEMAPLKIGYFHMRLLLVFLLFLVSGSLLWLDYGLFLGGWRAIRLDLFLELHHVAVDNDIILL